MSTAAIGASTARSAWSARTEFPHIASSGVPFMKRTTSSVSMISLIWSRSSVIPFLSS